MSTASNSLTRTRVTFRVTREGTVFAAFPERPADDRPGMIQCYTREFGFYPAEYAMAITLSRAATEPEAAPVLEELYTRGEENIHPFGYQEATMTAKQTARVRDADRADTLTHLRALCPKGSTVYGIVRHVSASGLSRRISFYALYDGRMTFLDGYMAGVLPLKRSPSDKGEGLIVGGSGMNMVMHTVSSLARVLYDDERALKHDTL